MIFLYIFLGILLFLFLISLIPVGIDARYRNSLCCTLKIGFVKIRLLPEKPKKKKKAVSKPDKSKKEKPEKDEAVSLKMLFKQNGVSGILNILKKIVSLATGALKDVFSHIIIRELSIDITTAGDNAADTALKYGYTCSGVYPAVSLITRICRCKTFRVLVSPDFTVGAKSNADCRVNANIKIFWLLKAAVVHGFKALQVLLKLKKAEIPVEQQDNEAESSKTDKSYNVNKE